jgi:hypothetical protein
MSIRGQVWETERPIRYSLPGLFGKYSENAATDYLTLYWDKLLVDSKAKIDGLDEQLSPLTCEEDFLPLLAVLSGFTGEYDITNYPAEAQRNLIDQSYSFIWRYKGSQMVLLYVLQQLNFDALVWSGARLIAGETQVPHTIGKQGFKSFVLLPIKFFRQTQEWELAESIVELYSPAYSDCSLCYDAFFAGFSVAGDPAFDWASISVEQGLYPPNELSTMTSFPSYFRLFPQGNSVSETDLTTAVNTTLPADGDVLLIQAFDDDVYFTISGETATASNGFVLRPSDGVTRLDLSSGTEVSFFSNSGSIKYQVCRTSALISNL